MQPTLVDNFISKESAKDLNMFLRGTVEINPMGKLSKQIYPFDLTHEVYVTIKSIVENIQKQFGFPEDQISINRVLYQVLCKGDDLGYHTDAYGGVDGYGIVGYSALLYLTDDYEGGEILFYEDNSGDKSIAYKPKVGTLVYFKGDDNYPHSVNRVISGERANIILFFDVKEEMIQ